MGEGKRHSREQSGGEGGTQVGYKMLPSGWQLRLGCQQWAAPGISQPAHAAPCWLLAEGWLHGLPAKHRRDRRGGCRGPGAAGQQLRRGNRAVRRAAGARQVQARHHVCRLLVVQQGARGLARHGRAEQVRLQPLAAAPRQLLAGQAGVQGAARARRPCCRHRAIERALDPGWVQEWAERMREQAESATASKRSKTKTHQVRCRQQLRASARPSFQHPAHLRRTSGRLPRRPTRSGGQDCTPSANRAEGRGGAAGEPQPPPSSGCAQAPASSATAPPEPLRCTAGGATGAGPHRGVHPGSSSGGAAKGSKLPAEPERAGEPCCRREGQEAGGAQASGCCGVPLTSTFSCSGARAAGRQPPCAACSCCWHACPEVAEGN